MNPNPRPRTCWTFNLSFIAMLLAALGLVIGFAPPAEARVAPESFLATQFFDVIGGGDALFLVSPGAVLHTPEGDYTGRDGLSRFGADLEASFHDLAFSTDSVEYVDSLVIIHFTLTGISSGAYQGIPATCGGISAPGVAVLQVSDTSLSGNPGVVVEQWIGYDRDAITSQLAAFAQWAPNTMFGCANHVLEEAGTTEALTPAYVPEPDCPKGDICDLPY